MRLSNRFTVSAITLSLLIACFCGASAAAQADKGKISFNFEGGKTHGFKAAEGGQKVFDICKSDIQQLQGDSAVTTLYLKKQKSDEHRMVIESPIFTLSGAKVSFLVGGGNGPGACVAICDAKGNEQFKARGTNNIRMRRVEWDASKHVGKKLFVRILDANLGSWGHITFDDFQASGTIDEKATESYRAKRKNILPKMKKKARRRKAPAPQPVKQAVPVTDSLRAAIGDLQKTYGDKYPAAAFLTQLDVFAKAIDTGSAAEKTKAQTDLLALQKKALIANPLIGGQEILYVFRKQYPGDHHNTATMFQTDEINTRKFSGGGLLKAVDLKTGKIRVVVDPGKDGKIRDPELDFDGKKIVFAMRKSVRDDYHIYTVNVDGTGLKQLTRTPGVFDIDPLYLADGSIVFTSSREPKYCMCNRHIMGNLYRMEADGANIHQIGRSTLHEGHSSLMPDGRILYDRWEYVDRNFGDAQGLWVVNPDGTNHAIFWGNNTGSPGGVIDARMIPGTELCLSIFGSCHDRPWGAMAIIDRRKGVDGRASVVQTWPAAAINSVDRGGIDTFRRYNPKYEDPFPLNDKYFIVSRMVGRGDEMGIYAADMFGNEIQLHRDSPGCFDPTPIAPRTRPKASPTRRDFKNKSGVFYVQNAYIGTHMSNVKPGAIKFLRVVESPPKRSWTTQAWGGQGVHCPAMNWHAFENKCILGTVPVEADGSAHFEVPADKFIYFQVLDKDGMMIQTMRSGTIIQSGETQGCVGCHENRVEDTPPLKKVPLAMKHPPSKMNGWHGEARKFSFQREVQPVFDKHCVKCHDFDKPGAKKYVLAGDRTVAFNASYTDLWSNGGIKCIGGGTHRHQEAYAWGSHASKIVKVIREGHPERKDGKKPKLDLSAEDFNRIVTWVDINAPYYPEYESAYPNNPVGRCPINSGQLKKLGQLTGGRFVTGNGRGRRAQIAFDRPEMSPCLQKLDKTSAKYKEALAIIQAGKDMLKKTPRADMEGFKPCPEHARRLAKYHRLMALEAANRKAILTGTKHYDPIPEPTVEKKK